MGCAHSLRMMNADRSKSFCVDCKQEVEPLFPASSAQTPIIPEDCRRKAALVDELVVALHNAASTLLAFSTDLGLEPEVRALALKRWRETDTAIAKAEALK